MHSSYKKYILDFRKPSGTSRGVLHQKETWFIMITDGERRGFGECGILRGLSVDDRDDYEEKLNWVCQNIQLGEEALWNALTDFPSIQFGLETAFRSLESRDPFVIFPSRFTDHAELISINGLIWMGSSHEMKMQIDEKISAGFTCLKLKIGALNFEDEIAILQSIRDNYTVQQLEIRVDANGGFDSIDAFDKLMQLSGLQIHSIEQPIAIKQHDIMSELCKTTPIPIALDEELIGVSSYDERVQLLSDIMPQFIILKPSLVGGFRGCRQWIEIAEQLGIGWWITSALESNIGLNAIAQFTFTLNNPLPQGLGTGGLYTNNFESPLTVSDGHLHYDKEKRWSFDLFD